TQEDWQTFRDYYFNCIQDSDNHLMDILLALKEMELLNNTIIIFTSDHGEMSGAHGLKGKGGLLYEENLHVPLVVYHPEYQGGRSIQALTSHIDLAPTFIHMTGLSEERKAEISQGLPGKNLMPLIDGTTDSVREAALFCSDLISTSMARVVLGENRKILYFTIDESVRGLMRAVITPRYKFARYFSGNFNTPTTIEALLENNDIVLYDLINDPEEMHNLADEHHTNKELIMEMNALLNKLISQEIGVDDGKHFRQVVKEYRESLN
ncbi:MAG: sulfatase-like hydrolase/transferase, partial [Thermotogota bacterium]